MNKYYAGIGSRETPPEVVREMVMLAQALSATYVLRSGGADGADSAFEEGARLGQGAAEIYLPWRGFNGKNSDLAGVDRAALELAQTVHPAWERLSEGPRKLHARNCYQVLGRSLNIPVDFVVCWTADGCETEAQRRSTTGGTATAIVLAHRKGIPVFNLKNAQSKQRLQEMLRTRGVLVTLEPPKPTPGQQTLF